MRALCMCIYIVRRSRARHCMGGVTVAVVGVAGDTATTAPLFYVEINLTFFKFSGVGSFYSILSDALHPSLWVFISLKKHWQNLRMLRMPCAPSFRRREQDPSLVCLAYTVTFCGGRSQETTDHDPESRGDVRCASCGPTTTVQGSVAQHEGNHH
jgi:hypothetical protein